VEARRTRSVARVQRLQALRAERAARRDVVGRVRLEVDAGAAGGKLVAQLENVHKAYGANLVVDDFSATLLRGDKVGLVGPNGAGKTTLLKLMLGELAPDRGAVRTGTRLQVAYFDQMRATLDPAATLADTISPGSEWIEIAGRRTHVMSYLGDFLFAPARANSPVSSLSGGERNRLLLARLFARPANVLVLDEPTNDLDIDTLELLEDLLRDYAGTVFLVSHDRRFLDNVVTSLIVNEAPGRWREVEGGIDDWLLQSRRAAALAAARGAPPGAVPAPPAPPAPAEAAPAGGRTAAAPAGSAAQGPLTGTAAGAGTRPPPRKLSYKEQRELDSLPARIEALEAEQKLLAAQLADPQAYAREGARMAALHERHAQIEDELMACLERWEALSAR
jgi:ATP-binding cassette subfamily F protein uup